MNKVLLAGLLLLLGGCESSGLIDDILARGSAGNSALSSQTIADGLREALSVGSGRVVDTLGVENGFLDGAFHIPLPEKLSEAQKIAGRFGLSKPFDELELRMNRAAEAATPKAKGLFLSAIRSMSFDDVMQVYRGGDDAATRYLERSTGASLQSEMRPIIDRSLADVGAVQTLESLVQRYNALPLVKPIDANLSGHVLDYANRAIFSQLAKEEAAIRKDPVKRTTQLLKTVFGG